MSWVPGQEEQINVGVNKARSGWVGGGMASTILWYPIKENFYF